MRCLLTPLQKILVVCTFMLTLAGCAPVAGPAADAAGHGDTGAAAPDKIVARQTVDVSAFTDLDPSSACWGEYWVFANVYETLTRYNPPGIEPFIAPGLATDWTVSDDGLTWTFHLKQGATFHDGTPVDAAAVKFSLTRNHELGCAGYLFNEIASIETPDAQTVVFHLATPLPLDVVLASGYSAWIMSPTSVGDQGADWFAAGSDAGSGPYRIAQYDPGQRMVLERFAPYWRGWEPGQVDSIIFELVEDPTAVEQMLRAGELDLASSRALAPEQMASLASGEQLLLDVSPGSLNSVLYLNQRRAPMDNLLVRQALAYSFPYDDVIANTNLGKGTRAHGAVPVVVWGHSPAGPRYGYDPAKAKALLAEAGYAGGIEMEFSFDASEKPMAELWQAALAEIGVDLKLTPTDWGTRTEQVKNDPANAAHINSTFWGPDALGPYTYLFGMFHSEEKPTFNLGYYNNPAFDAQIDEAYQLAGIDRAAASALFADAQHFLDDDAAAIFVQDFPNLTILAGDIQGYVGNPGYNNAVSWYDVRR